MMEDYDGMITRLKDDYYEHYVNNDILWGSEALNKSVIYIKKKTLEYKYMTKCKLIEKYEKMLLLI